MNGNCHLIFGTAVGITTALLTEIPLADSVALVSTCIIGSVFCDIDSETSHMGQLTKPVSTVVCKISAMFGKTKEKHRGIFHDPTVYIIGLILTHMYLPELMGFFIGALSHLFLDMFNPAGIPLLGVKRIHIAKIPASSKQAIVMTWVFTAIIISIPIMKMNGFI